MTISNFGYAKVMIADDSALIRTLVSDSIKDLLPDCKIMEAENGVDVIKKYSKFQPDVVFMDINMPNANGFIALNDIKKRQQKARIIMMTADQREETCEKAARLGADGFLTKPFGIDQVISALKEL